MLNGLTPGDVVTVTRIDRLARSTFDLFAKFRSLAEPWADTSTSTGRLMIAVLGGLADVERDLHPHPHRRGPQPGAKARAAYGPTTEIDTGAEGRGPRTTGAGRNPCRTRAQLRRGKEHDFTAHALTMTRPRGACVHPFTSASVWCVQRMPAAVGCHRKCTIRMNSSNGKSRVKTL
jgi:Resolvase, N terminal domain